MKSGNFLFSDLFWALIAILGILIGGYFQHINIVKHFTYLCAVIFVFLGLKSLIKTK